MIVWDIETGPVSDEELRRVVGEFDRSSVPHPGSFDEGAVKLGKMVDPEKIAAKIESARKEHAAAVASYASDIVAAENAHWQAARDRAALDPMTGQVLAIGYLSLDKDTTIIHGQEKEETEGQIVRAFWSQYMRCREDRRPLAGFNIHGFDLPFLMRRSWLLDVKVPRTVVTEWNKFDKVLVDLRKTWGCGEYQPKGNLGKICNWLGVGDKPEDGTTGADFARLWWGTEEEREKAKEYLRNDLQMTRSLAERLCVTL